MTLFMLPLRPWSAEVCAGLPLLSTLKGLVESGDRVKTIEGVMSTTLGYIFSAYDGSQKFSELVRSKTMRAVERVVGSFSSHISPHLFEHIFQSTERA